MFGIMIDLLYNNRPIFQVLPAVPTSVLVRLQAMCFVRLE